MAGSRERQLWDGRTAIMTGGSHGIGRAIADVGVREGGSVWLFDLDEGAGRRVATSLGTADHFVKVDLTEPGEISSAVRAVIADRGAVDILINNASRDANYDARTMQVSEWTAVMDLDLMAPWLVSQAVLPTMVQQGHGSIVNLGSLRATETAEGAFRTAQQRPVLPG